MSNSIWIGYDPRETAAYAVAGFSIRRRLTQPLPIRGVVLSALRTREMYRRPTEIRRSAADRPIMWDSISDAPMSTEHAIARFLVPLLAGSGWAMFTDGDVLALGNVARAFDGLDSTKAVYCVQHSHVPPVGIKMDGQEQTRYARKNWSSVMIFNCWHPANRALTVDLVNSVPGRDLHGFCWLTDDLIGRLDQKWNHLADYTRNGDVVPEIVHYTSGTPDMAGYEHCEYSREWFEERERWALAMRC